jgi:hypothetical protein
MGDAVTIDWLRSAGIADAAGVAKALAEEEVYLQDAGACT